MRQRRVHRKAIPKINNAGKKKSGSIGSRLRQTKRSRLAWKRGRRSRAPHGFINSLAHEAGAAGERDGALHSAGGPHMKNRMNELWSQWYISRQRRLPWEAYFSVADAYLKGFSLKSEMAAPDWVLLPKTKTIGAIVMAMNEEKTIPSVIKELSRLPIDEIIFVINGSTDNSFTTARKLSNSTIVHYSHPLGHDVGRAIGAKLAQSDILLFMDGDFPIFAEHLAPFIYAVQTGMDVALNNITPYLGVFSTRDTVTKMKEWLNRCLGRPDLAANSLTAVPHALSRRAVEVIGCDHLLVPPKAHAIAILNGLSIGAPTSVDVITKNKIRNNNVGISNPVAEMIIGDHVEALSLIMKTQGERITFPDRLRNRAAAGGGAS